MIIPAIGSTLLLASLVGQAPSTPRDTPPQAEGMMLLFESDFSKATVITMFLLPDLNLRLRPIILGLKPGTRVVSNTFHMDDWEPDETAVVHASAGCENSWCTALLWIVSAKVEGTHKLAQGELKLEQKFQMLSGTLTAGGKSVPVTGKVLGEQVTITAAGKTMKGRFNGKGLELKG